MVDPAAVPTVVRVIALGSDYLEKQIDDVLELDSITATHQRVWVDVIGLGSESTLRTIANMFHLHPLVIEDVVNVHQRAKVEEFEDGLFVVARMVDGDDPTVTEQLSMYLKGNVL
ncbi:MAG: CorA family divalent cation transporter, partial [Pirellula sp.]